jgi:DNA-binding MarR family transcriptional regulator
MSLSASGDNPARFMSLPSWLMTQAGVHAHRLVTEGLAAEGARGYHYRLLSVLDDSGPASQAQLGRRSGIHLSDLVAAINELADRGFIHRSPDPADRRRNIITITGNGRRGLRRLDKKLLRVQEELLSPLSAGERDQLARLLTQILGHQGR